MAGLNIDTEYENRILKTPLTVRYVQRDSAASVIYVMSRDQRIADNYGLALAQQVALRNRLPLVVVFSFLTMKGRAREHYNFMLQGLFEISAKLRSLNIPFIPLFGRHDETIPLFAQHSKPLVIITDFSPLRGALAWQKTVASRIPLMVVDSHNCVPVWISSDKQEYSARTIRPKIYAKLSHEDVPTTYVVNHPYTLRQPYSTLEDSTEELGKVRRTYMSNGTFLQFTPGEDSARKQLESFINNRLYGYSARRNDPSVDGLSGLSPYLHFGSLGSVTVIRRLREAVLKDGDLQIDSDALTEELVVRKELSDNFCYYNQNYTSLLGAPQWAQDTLRKHRYDAREHVYSIEEFEQALTHDAAWNAAQVELRATGKMHGYMRMYWAKKILEWSESPESALHIAQYLNDFYSIDGADPNGYTGILWSIAGLHDRPWGERPVYGTVRSMVYNGLKRKFDIQAYIQKYEP